MKADHILSSDGKKMSFRGLYDELSPRMLFYVFKMTHDRHISKDIVHEAFVFYWENQNRFSSVIDVKAYLFSVLRNLVRNHARVEDNRKRILDTIEPPLNDQEDYLMITAEICGQIRQVVSELPSQTRSVIELSMAGMSVGEIAQQLDVSPNTVKTLKKKGYQFLRERLAHLRLLLHFLMTA